MTHRASHLVRVLLLVLLSACRDGPTTADPGPTDLGPEPTGPGTVETSGSVQLPAGRSPSEFKLVAGFNEGVLSENGYRIRLNEDAVQMLAVVSSTGEPQLLSVRPVGAAGVGGSIDAASTAEALLFLNPFFVTSDPVEAQSVLGKIRGLASFGGLVNVIGGQLALGTFNWSEGNQELHQALEAAFVELQSDLAPGSEEAAPRPVDVIPGFEVNGLEAIDVVQNGESVSLRLRNSRKRWISVYVDKSTNGRTFTSSGPMVDLVPSPDISILALLLRGTSSLSETSETITTSTAGYSHVAVKAYGLGLGYNLPEHEISRAIWPSVASVVFDIGLPTVEVFTGIRLSQDLRGRPVDHPFYQLVLEVGEGIIRDGLLVDDFYRFYRNGDILGITAATTRVVMDALADNPRLVADLITQIAGQAIARSVVDSWLFPVRLVTATIKSANLVFSLASVITSEVVTTFIITSADVGGVEPVRASGIVRDASVTGSSSGIAGATVSFFDERGNQVAVGRTLLDGRFSVEVPAGQIRIRVVADGFRPVNQSFRVQANAGGNFVVPTVFMTPLSKSLGSVSGTVRDVMTLAPIGSATVTLRFGANISTEDVVQETMTGSNGVFEFRDLIAGTFTAYFEADGYADDFLIIPVQGGVSRSGFDMSLNPELSSAGYRIVLSWGASPTDLDAHLFTPPISGVPHHVFYLNRGATDRPPFAFLDVDDITSYGPETITIMQVFPGEYVYGVHQYSLSGSLTLSNAQVALYGNQGLLRTWSVPVNGSGTWWNVFKINGSTGMVTSVNTLGNPPSLSAATCKEPCRVYK